MKSLSLPPIPIIPKLKPFYNLCDVTQMAKIVIARAATLPQIIEAEYADTMHN